MSIYQQMKAAGVPVESHASDLYVPDTPQVREILQRFGRNPGTVLSFTSQIDGKRWFDIPFAHDPFWERSGASDAAMNEEP